MSTDEVRLSELDSERSEIIKKLPWYKKFYRRFMTGDSFVAWQLSSLQTWLTAFPAGLVAGASAGSVATSFPMAWGFAAKTIAVAQNSWATVTAFTAGLVKVAFSFGN